KGGDRAVEVVDLVSGFGGVEHLEEDHAVDRDHRIVLGDDLLAWDLKDLLHHVDSAADAIEERRDIIESRFGNADEPPEMFDRVAIALAHDFDAGHHVEQHKHRNGG